MPNRDQEYTSITVRILKQQSDLIHALSRKTHVSSSEIICEAINDKLQKAAAEGLIGMKCEG